MIQIWGNYFLCNYTLNEISEMAKEIKECLRQKTVQGLVWKWLHYSWVMSWFCELRAARKAWVDLINMSLY